MTSIAAGDARATIATDGGGNHAGRFAASRGGPAEFPPNAATAMTHIAIHEALDGKVVDRMEGARRSVLSSIGVTRARRAGVAAAPTGAMRAPIH